MKDFTLNELAAISRLLKYENQCIDKLTIYSENCSDPDLRQKFQQFAAKHKNHCNILLKQLDGDV